MTSTARRAVWSKVYAISTWSLIVYFSLMAVIHLVLTMLFYLGIWDTGVGYVLDYDVPGWLITILDGSAACLLWAGYRRGTGHGWLGLVQTLVASAIMVSRALWFAIIPLLVLVTISGAIHRLVSVRQRNQTRA